MITDISEIRLEVAKRLAALHGANVTGVDRMKYRTAGEGWWNTAEVRAHFGKKLLKLSDSSTFNFTFR